MQSSTLIQISPVELTELITTIFKTELDEFKKQLQNQSANDDLLTREQVLKLLQVDPSTLWHWQNKGKIVAYKFANKSYFKRSEIMATITPLKK